MADGDARTVDELVEHALDERIELPDEPAQVEALAELGPAPGSGAVSAPEHLDALRAWRGQIDRADGLTRVFMDATTLLAAQRLLLDGGGDALTPATLLDLATFAANVVLADEVVHVANPDVDDGALNRALGWDVVVSIELPPVEPGPEPQPGPVAALKHLWEWNEGYIADLHAAAGRDTLLGRETDALRRGWEALVGHAPTADDLFAPHEYRDSVSSNAVDQLDELVRATAPHEWRLATPEAWSQPLAGSALGTRLLSRRPGRLRSLISRANHRSSYNALVANVLDVPYTPNMARAPFQRFLAERAGEVADRLAANERLDAMHRERLLELLPARHPAIALPVVLAAALSRSSTLADVRAVLGDLRGEAEAFRATRRELDRAAGAGDLAPLADLHEALRAQARLLTPKAAIAPGAGMAGVMVSVAFANPAPLVATAIGLLFGAVQGIDGGLWTKLRWRLLKPELWFVASLGTSARELTDVLPTVARLWGLDHHLLRGFGAALGRIGAQRGL